MNYTPPYYSAYNNMYQPIYRQPMQQPTQQVQPMQMQQNYLQGKMVDSIDVVKATDIPLDGSISYFAITDGSLIATKQLQMDGTTKITVYKPMTNEVNEPVKTGITIEEINECFANKIEELKKQIEDLKESFKTEKAKK